VNLENPLGDFDFFVDVLRRFRATRRWMLLSTLLLRRAKRGTAQAKKTNTSGSKHDLRLETHVPSPLSPAVWRPLGISTAIFGEMNRVN
jgi:hypothetical protein